MGNRESEAAWAYHNATKHSWQSVRRGAHYLDGPNQPLPFKVYKTLEPIPLPRDLSRSDVPALSAVSSLGWSAAGRRVPDLKTLASLFFFSAGITRKRRYPGGEIHFRAASCTGALYHIELYLVCADLPGLEAGVYHFSVHDFALRRLRAGDYRRAIVDSAPHKPAALGAPAIVLCTTTFWRNAWKYQARAYRHAFWDSGTILANLLAVAAARRVPARVVVGYADQPVNELLDLDTQKEVAIALVALGQGAPPAPEAAAMRPLGLETLPLSKREVDYPVIRAMHGASCLARAEEVVAWRGEAPAAVMPSPSGRLFPLKPLGPEAAPAEPIEQVVLRRGSTRRFSHDSITLEQLSTALLSSTRGIPADFLEPPGATLNHLYLIVNNVDGLPQGAYALHRERQAPSAGSGQALELLMQGDFRSQAGYLGLEQELPADAAADIFFLADLNAILGRYGNRGYRAAQLEAGIMGGKLYLSAYAQGFGATGLTFYDDDVTDFFSPHAAGKSVMFLVALGRPARRGRAA